MSNEATSQEITLLQKKATVYFNRGEKVHISFKKGHWKRGIIQEVSADFFMLNETLEGMMPIFFLEIKDIRPYVDRSYD